MHEISNDLQKKFDKEWSKVKVEFKKDNARKRIIETAVKPQIGKQDVKTIVADMPEVKEIVKDVHVCWGCLSEACLKRQKLSFKLLKDKKLPNTFRRI